MPVLAGRLVVYSLSKLLRSIDGINGSGTVLLVETILEKLENFLGGDLHYFSQAESKHWTRKQLQMQTTDGSNAVFSMTKD